MFDKLALEALRELASQGKLIEYKDKVRLARTEFDKSEHTTEEVVQFFTDVKEQLEAIKAVEAELEAEAAAADDEDEDQELSVEDTEDDGEEELSAEDNTEEEEEEEAPAEELSATTAGVTLDQVAEIFELFKSTQTTTPVPAPVETTAVDMSNRGQDAPTEVEIEEKLAYRDNVKLRSGKEFSRERLQEDLMNALRSQHLGTSGEVIWIGTTYDDFEPEFTLKADDKTGNFEAITASMKAHAESEDALTAAICCVPNDVIRDLATYCSVEGTYDLPRVGAPRGGLTYAVPSHACGLVVEPFEWKEHCDPEAEPQPDKPCQEIECGHWEDVRVSAYGHCWEYSNGTERFNPEQLEYYLAEGQCRFEHLLSQRRLDMVLSHPRVAPNVQECVAAPGSLVAAIKEILSVKFNDMRNQLCNRNLRLNVVAPVWIDDMLMIDAARRGDMSGTASLSTIVSSLGGTLQLVNHWQEPEAGECVYPEDVQMLVHIPGMFREVDGGEMNFGVIRDSVLSAQNKARLLFERWSSLANFGPDCGACILDITGLCANGAVGPRVDACAA